MLLLKSTFPVFQAFVDQLSTGIGEPGAQADA